MMNDRMYSMSAYSPISEMTRKINQILDSTVGISAAIANSPPKGSRQKLFH